MKIIYEICFKNRVFFFFQGNSKTNENQRNNKELKFKKN